MMSPNDAPAWLKSELAEYETSLINNAGRIIYEKKTTLESGELLSLTVLRLSNQNSYYTNTHLKLEIDKKGQEKPQNILLVELPLNTSPDRKRLQHELAYLDGNFEKIKTNERLFGMVTKYCEYLVGQNIPHNHDKSVRLVDINRLPVKNNFSSSNGYSGAISGGIYIKTIPPLILLKVLHHYDLIVINSVEKNTRLEDFIKVTVKGVIEEQLKLSVRNSDGLKSGDKAEKRLWWVDSYSGKGGQAATSLLKLLATKGAVKSFSPNYNPDDKDMNFALRQKIEVMIDSYKKSGHEILEYDEDSTLDLGVRIPRLPQFEEKLTDNRRQVAHEILSKIRKVDPKLVDQLLDSGEIGIGAHHDVNGNYTYYNQMFVKMNMASNNEDLTNPSSRSHPSNYQRLYMGHDKKLNQKKLQKRFVRSSSAQFVGTPQKNAQTLWLTEGVLDYISFNELQGILSAHKLPHAESNAISVLSTGGLRSFLEKTFDLQFNTEQDDSITILSEQNKSETRDLLTSEELKKLKIFFEANALTYALKETESSIKSLELLKRIVKATGAVVSISTNVSPKDLKGNTNFYVMDQESIQYFLKTNNIQIKTVGGEDKLIRSKVSQVYKKINELTPTEKNTFIYNIRSKLKSILGCDGLGSAFDADTAGLKAARLLEAFSNACKLPYSHLVPNFTKVTGVSVKGNDDHNDVLMTFKELSMQNRSEDALLLLKQYSKSLVTSPSLERKDSQLTHKMK
ncbi:MAG: hypothetical protein HAW67_02560 [Endozoicomonadaceae bacterium]|nr:hypothetical protein [Endozoicomonadaceae bacterium]